MEQRPKPPHQSIRFQRRVQSLFERALDVSPEKRQEWLEQECGDELGLKAEIAGLLAVSDESERFLDGEQAARSFHAIESIEPGERVGPYEVVRELGRGGMGVVLLARRADGQFEQQVALKLLKRGMDSGAILSAFLRERQILAWLQHPKIARLYDGGITEDGRPWFALEHVEGRPITDYCDAEGLDLRARIEIVIDACEAIQHAHRQLVIHRDLKPSNVLVTDEGELKVLDFGIAAVLKESGTESPDSSRDSGAMTPEYAAPEQFSRQPVTTAIDVHALGVLLYELLTGQRPHRLPSDSPDELARLGSASHVELPSRVAHRTDARRRLRGDLDRILLKAIHKEPERRYGSAETFAADLRRYLGARPVVARRSTLLYRLSKFAQRNRWGLLGAGVVVLAIAGAGAFISVERTQTERERERTQSVKEFLVNLVESANPNAEGGAALRDEAILHVAMERAETELSGDPDMQAELYEVVGHAYIARGDLDRAADPLTRSLELRREIHGEMHPAVADANYAMAALLRREERYEEAERYYRAALDIQVALEGRRSLEASVLLNGLGANAYGAGDLDKAERYYRESLAVKEELLADDDQEIATGRHNLALLLRKKGELEEAERLMRLALDVNLGLHGDAHPVTAMSHGGLGRILHSMGRCEEAVEEYRRSYEIRFESYGSDHPYTRMAHHNLAQALFDGSDLDGAEEHFRSLLREIEQDLGEASVERVGALCDLATVLLASERIDEAQALFEQAGELSASLDEDGSESAARAAAGEGAAALARGELDPALSKLTTATASYEARGRNEDRGGLEARIRLAECLSRLGRFDEADSLFFAAYEALQEKLAYTWEARLARDRLRDHLRRSGRGAELGRLD